jgi:cytoskeleton protein RodZ
MASFGDTLRRERELRGVDLRDIAEATKISVRFLQALEQDRVDILPGGIFPKAFVRQYARHLGLDPERTVAEFVYAYGEPPPARPSAPSDVRLGGGVPRGLVLGGLVVAVVGFLAWRMWGGSGDTSSGQAASTLTATPQGTPFPTDRVYPPPTPPPSDSVSPAAGIVVTLSARENTWAEIKVDGTAVLSRNLEVGETQKLEARNEVLLSLGNAGGVTYTVNGRPGIPLGRSGEVRRNIAINTQSLPSLLQSGAAPAAGTPAPGAPRPATPRPRPSPLPSPSPSPEEESVPESPAPPEPSPVAR